MTSTFANFERNMLVDISTNLNKTLKWVQIAVAVDSGSVAHVCPENVFALTLEPNEMSKSGATFFAADESPIKNKGSQTVKAYHNNGGLMNITFNVCENLARPLLSVSELVTKGNSVLLTANGGSIQCGKTKIRYPLRREGKLFMLDMWCQVPESLANASTFVRQAP